MITKKTALANALKVAFQANTNPDELAQALTTALETLREEKEQLGVAHKILQQAEGRTVPRSLRKDAERYEQIAQAVETLTLLKIALEKAEDQQEGAQS